MIQFFATFSWILTVLYWPGEITQTYDPSLQEPNICLDQIRSESTWPINRMSQDLTKKVKRPVFIGCFHQSFQEEYNLFEKIVIDQPPTNKWYIVDFDNKGDYSYQGPMVMEECMKHFFRAFPADDPVIAGCVDEPGLRVLKGAIHSRFIYNQHHKETK